MSRTIQIDNLLTIEERAWVQGLYCGCPMIGDRLSHRLVLKQLKYMPDKDVFMLCYWYDDIPFQGTQQSDWVIHRDSTEIKVFHKGKGHAYIIDTHNGDVNILRGGMRSHLGTAAYAFQFHIKHHYAFPLFFERGHWANGKTPFQLGMAVPDMQPMHDALDILFDKDESLAQQYLFDKKLHNVDLNNIDIFEQELSVIKKLLKYKD